MNLSEAYMKDSEAESFSIAEEIAQTTHHLAISPATTKKVWCLL